MAWFLDPATGDYVADSGHLRRDDGLQGPITTYLLTERGSRLDDLTFGSRLHELRRAPSARLAALRAPDMVKEALQPMIDDGRLLSVSAAAEVAARRAAPGVSIVVTVESADGTELTFSVWESVG